MENDISVSQFLPSFLFRVQSVSILRVSWVGDEESLLQDKLLQTKAQRNFFGECQSEEHSRHRRLLRLFSSLGIKPAGQVNLCCDSVFSLEAFAIILRMKLVFRFGSTNILADLVCHTCKVVLGLCVSQNPGYVSNQKFDKKKLVNSKMMQMKEEQ